MFNLLNRAALSPYWWKTWRKAKGLFIEAELHLMCLSSGEERGDVAAELDALGELPLASWGVGAHFSERYFHPSA